MRGEVLFRDVSSPHPLQCQNFFGPLLSLNKIRIILVIFLGLHFFVFYSNDDITESIEYSIRPFFEQHFKHFFTSFEVKYTRMDKNALLHFAIEYQLSIYCCKSLFNSLLSKKSKLHTAILHNVCCTNICSMMHLNPEMHVRMFNLFYFRKF